MPASSWIADRISGGGSASIDDLAEQKLAFSVAEQSVGAYRQRSALDWTPVADRSLREIAHHHHRTDGHPAVRYRLRIHGAALEHGDAAAVAGGGAGRRSADRRLQGLSAGLF